MQNQELVNLIGKMIQQQQTTIDAFIALTKSKLPIEEAPKPIQVRPEYDPQKHLMNFVKKCFAKKKTWTKVQLIAEGRQEKPIITEWQIRKIENLQPLLDVNGKWFYLDIKGGEGRQSIIYTAVYE